MAGWLKIIKRKHDSRTGHIIENWVTLFLVRNSSWNALDCFWFWGMPWSQELSVLPELSPLVLHTWKMNHIFPASFAEHVCNPAKTLCQTMFSLCGYFCLHHPSQRQHQYLWFLLLFSSPSPLHCPTLHIKLQLKSAYKVDLQLNRTVFPHPSHFHFSPNQKTSQLQEFSDSAHISGSKRHRDFFARMFLAWWKSASADPEQDHCVFIQCKDHCE